MILAVDGANLGYNSFHAYGDLSYDEIPTGVTFGFLKRLLEWSEKFGSNRFVFCWDSRYSLRREIFSDYKLKRRPTTTEEIAFKTNVKKQFEVLRTDILPWLGFRNNILRYGYEADDIMATLVEKCHDQSENVTLFTTDNDMYQLLKNCNIFDFRRKKLLDLKWFCDKYGFDPASWAFAKSIGGCGTDGVPGIPGFADPSKYKRGKRSYTIDFVNGKKTKKMQEKYESYDKEGLLGLYYSLVKLPFKGKKKIVFRIEKDNFKLENFVGCFEYYRFHSFLENKVYKRWKESFKL